MGKDAISQPPKTKESGSSKNGYVGASPIVFIISILAIISIVLFLFKDRIFKKKSENQNLSDLADKPKEEQDTQEEKTVIEELSPQESVEITQRFDATKDDE